MGMIEGIYESLDAIREKKLISALEEGKLKAKKIEKIMSIKPRIERLVVKDEKVRTFIADTTARGRLVSHVYDVTYGLVHNDTDTLVLMDDSIVRGTTLRDSIIEIASRLRPKKIIVLSSAPQIRYPDCSGIDMSKMGEFVAFRALVDLLKNDGREHLLEEAYQRCKA